MIPTAVPIPPAASEDNFYPSHGRFRIGIRQDIQGEFEDAQRLRAAQIAAANVEGELSSPCGLSDLTSRRLEGH